ncbi:MAG: NUDIX domain-containing protein [Anaerolineales bacterium]|nr:NUDIX domain-containing protein [Anaerolineales bacterium]
MNRIRVLALAVFWRGDEILVNEWYDSVKRETFYRPPGGGVEFGERVIDALRREMHEELGAEIRDVRSLQVTENLFVCNGKPGHEIVWLHSAAFVDSAFYVRDEFIIDENGIRGRAVWKSLREFERGVAPLYPDGLLELLKSKTKD